MNKTLFFPITVKYYGEFFDLEYPLPKMDMAGIPDFGPGAMENWGMSFSV